VNVRGFGVLGFSMNDTTIEAFYLPFSFCFLTVNRELENGYDNPAPGIQNHTVVGMPTAIPLL
jgi:hypothetical protein